MQPPSVFKVLEKMKIDSWVVLRQPPGVFEGREEIIIRNMTKVSIERPLPQGWWPYWI